MAATGNTRGGFLKVELCGQVCVYTERGYEVGEWKI